MLRFSHVDMVFLFVFFFNEDLLMLEVLVEAEVWGHRSKIFAVRQKEGNMTWDNGRKKKKWPKHSKQRRERKERERAQCIMGAPPCFRATGANPRYELYQRPPRVGITYFRQGLCFNFQARL